LLGKPPPDGHQAVASVNIPLTEFHPMASLLPMTVHYKVRDYAAWRTDYNANEKSRLLAGITNGRVFRNADDQNDLVVLQDAADVAKARTWFGSDDLKAAMQKSGVIGSPSIRFAT
jgi:hypothetical protein